MSKIKPCLWFDDQAEEAASFYVSVFSALNGWGDSKILNVSRYGEAGPRPAGTVMTVEFQLAGQELMALNGGPEFAFSPAISLFVSCETQDEVDLLWEKLTEGGKEVQCGWLEDRYGVSWQVIPSALGELLGDPNPARSQRVMEAMLKMVKIDVDELRRATAAA